MTQLERRVGSGLLVRLRQLQPCIAKLLFKDHGPRLPHRRRLCLELQFLDELDQLKPKAQDDARATYAPKLTRDTAHIRWSEPAARVAGVVRALDPEPGAWTELDGRVFKLFGAKVVDGGGPPGQIQTTDDGLRITAGEGAVAIDDVQPAGKPRMAAAEWLRGGGRGTERGGRRFT